MKLRRNLWFVIACLCFSLSIGGCDNPQQKEAKHIKNGNAYFEKGAYEKARLEYKNAARLMPTAAEPYYRLGLVDEEEGLLRNAFAGFTVAVQQDAHFHPALLKIAQYYMAAEQYDETRSRIDIVLSEAPDNAEAHALLAALLLRQKDFDNAEKEAKLALIKDPMNLSACAALTGIYSAKGEYDKAEAALAEGIAKHPRKLSLLILRVLLYEKMNDMPKVAEAYRAIFRLKPEEIRFRSDLASIYIEQKKPDEAEAVLREGVAELPDNWPMKHRLVLFLGEKRGIDAAEKEIKGLMQAHPKNDDLYFWLADLYANSGATEKAMALLEEVVAKQEDNAPALNARTLLARINIKRGNTDLADKLVATVLSKAPDNRPALFVRANLSFGKGYYQSAISDLRTILRNAPNDQETLQLLAETLLLQGHVDLAIDTMKKLVDLAPMNTAMRVRLAQIVNLNGDNKQAMDMISTVTKAFPNYPVGWESAARFAIEAKQWLPAQAAIRELEKLDGQRLTAAFLEARILSETGKDDDAVAKLSGIINADPATPLAEHALRNLMEIYARQSRFEVAASYLETLKTDSPLVSAMLARCYAKTGRWTESAAAFDRAIAAHADFADPYVGRAEIYLKERQSEQAMDILRKGTKAAPGDFLVPMRLAGLLAESGKYQEAVALYDDILTRNPEFNAAANNLAELIADYQHNDAAALEKARQTAERFSGSSNPYFLDTLAWVYFRQGKISLAQTLIERAMAQREIDIPAQIHYHYGAILLKSGNIDKAKAELQQATSGSAAYPGLEEAKKMLNGI